MSRCCDVISVEDAVFRWELARRLEAGKGGNAENT